MFWLADCSGQKSGTAGQREVERRAAGDSLSGSLTSDQRSDEADLLPREHDYTMPVDEIAHDLINPVENLGEGIFGEVCMSLSFPSRVGHGSDPSID